MSKSPQKTSSRSRTPDGRLETTLAWITGLVGALVVLAVLAVVIVDGMGADEPARLVAREIDRRVTPGGVVVDVELRNLGGRPAGDVEVQGLSATHLQDEAAATTPYVAGRSRRQVALVFEADPGQPSLTVRGWTEP